MKEFNQLNDLLKWTRKQCGLTQLQVSLLSGVARPKISRYETGAQCPSYETMDKLYTQVYRKTIQTHKLYKTYWTLWRKRAAMLKRNNIPRRKRRKTA